MSNYDDGESFAVGDDSDRVDWYRLRRLRRLIGTVADDTERRAIVLEVLEAVYGTELEVR